MNTQNKKIQLLASTGLLGTAVIWGFAFVIVKNSLNLIPTAYMLAFRFTIGAAALAAVFAGRLRKLNKKIWRDGFVLGGLLFISYLLQTEACKYTTAGKNAFLTTVYVVLIPFLNWAINKKKPDIFCVVAAFTAIAGIGLLSLQGDLSVNIGDIMTLFCGLGFAVHMIYIDRFTDRDDPILLSVVQLIFVALFSWLAAPVMNGGFPKEAFSAEIIQGMLYLGLLSSAAGFLLQIVGQKYISPSTTSLILSTEAVFGAFFSVLLLNEIFTLKMAAGCVFILAAIVLAETKLEFLPWFKKEQIDV